MAETRWGDRRRRLRTLLTNDDCYFPASVYDPMSLRIAEHAGFECAMLAGSIASLTVLGAPDLIALTLSEFAEQARRVNRAGSLPLMVDADHGYGNAINVMRTVEELETAGVSGLSIEDTVLPRTFGEGKTALVSLAEGVGKMRAAVTARRDAELVIAARTNARVIPFDEVMQRVAAYQQTGVDALFVVGVQTFEELERLARVATLPLILGGASTGMLAERERLAGNGVRICLRGHQTMMAALQAVKDTLQALRNDTPLPQLLDDSDLKRYSAAGDYAAWTDEFLKQ